MASIELTQLDWDIRLYVYDVLVATGQAPTVQTIADHFTIQPDDTRGALYRLNDAHALFLRPNSDDIMMAHPLSAVETDYRVKIDDVRLYANCAWDSLGIPAMLKQDAQVTIQHPLTRETITYAIENDNLIGDEGGLVHFALPFAQWYDDLIDT